MSIEGKWWYLHEEEPLTPRSRCYALQDGRITDAHTGLPAGVYEVAEHFAVLGIRQQLGDYEIERTLQLRRNGSADPALPLGASAQSLQVTTEDGDYGVFLRDGPDIEQIMAANEAANAGVVH